MNKINLKVLRDLKKMKLHTLAIILTLACGIGVYSGVDMAIKSLYFTRDKILKDMSLADLEIQILPEDVRNLPDFKNIQGLKKVERRLIMPGTMTLKQGQKLTALMIFMEELNPQINKVRVIKGKEINPEILNEALIEKTMHEYYGIEPGDTIDVKVGEKIYKNKITGINISPEYIIISANPEYFLPEKGSLGVFFGSLKQIDKNLGFTMVNDLIFSYDENADRDKVQAAIVERLKNVNLERVVPFKENFAFKYLDIDLHAYELYTPAIILVLGALSFIITLINFNRLIQQERKEIGAILALGYHPMQIIKAYAFGAGIICIGGLIFGLPLSLLLRNVFSSIYSSAQGLIYLYNNIYISSIIKGVIFAILTIGISFYIPLRKMLKLSPREIIHPPMKDSVIKNSFIRFLFNKTSTFSLVNRIGIRNVFREHKRSVSTMISIALSCGVAISYMASTTSTIKTVEDRFRKGKWHLVVDFLYPVFYEDYEEIKKIEGVTETEPFFRHYVELAKNGSDKFEGSGMLGIKINSVMRELPLLKGRSLKNKDEIVLSYDLFKKIKLNMGDKVDVKVGLKKYTFTLVGIKSDVVVGESFIDFSRAREIFEFPDEASGIFVKTKPDLREKVEQAIYNKEFVGKVAYKEKLVNKFLTLMDEATKIVDVATGISIFVALLFIFTSINMSISEREGEFATLKAMGFSRKLIKNIVISESMTIGMLSALITIPIAMVITVFLNYLMTEAWFNVDTYFSTTDFFWGIIPMLTLIPISIIPALKYLVKMNIPETLRTKIIE
ncbi:ABC transporter permease [Candidatus Poribacteria bacterium]|nr:ABC transporter permease [Candidatus Poribacteria bacterium]